MPEPPFRRWAVADHEENSRAQQAAEALFAPKRQIALPSTPATMLPADQTARKPRILSAVRVQPARVEALEVSVSRAPPKPREKIPPAHLTRIRAWLKYGMTIAQVAEIYEVTSGDIERILQKT